MLGLKEKTELDFNGVYRLSKGKLSLITDEITLPNGLDFSPDFSKLYITDTTTSVIYSLDVKENGEFENLESFIDQESVFANRNLEKISEFAGAVGGDGLKVDSDGNLFVATTQGVVVYNSKGELLGEIKLDTIHTNLAFGGSDGKTLFITARENVYKIEVLTGKK